MLMNIYSAKQVLRIDKSNTANDEFIKSLCDAMPSYVETVTGMTTAQQMGEPLVDTLNAFLIRLWYFADHAEDQKLQRTIDALLKAITLKANAYNRQTSGAGSNG